ncbi:ABC transporter permease [Treponema primitia]|uniref:ABC transporter permease n=1 Tax=Treponema primitia TaxID=88058 RepID=UPI00397FE230
MRQETIRRLTSIGLLTVLLLFFGLSNKTFLTPANLTALLRDCSPIGIVAVGVTMIIITAGIDLSTGAMAGFVAMLCANLLYYAKLPGAVIVLIALAAGTLSGLLNGALVAYLRLPDFIATLSTQFLFRGLSYVLAIRNEFGMISNKIITDPVILTLSGSIGGIYLVTFAFAIVAIAGQFIMKRTKLGTYTYAIGANRRSAELSGISYERTKMAVFAITGFLVGMASVFLMGRIRSVTPDTGTGMEFDVIAAVVMGGVAFSGGRGDVVGTVIGTVFMMTLINGIYKYNLPTAVQLIIKGGVIIIMIIFDSVYAGYMYKRDVHLIDTDAGTPPANRNTPRRSRHG